MQNEIGARNNACQAGGSQQSFQFQGTAQSSAESTRLPARQAAHFADGDAVDCALHSQALEGGNLRRSVEAALRRGDVKVRKTNAVGAHISVSGHRNTGDFHALMDVPEPSCRELAGKPVRDATAGAGVALELDSTAWLDRQPEHFAQLLDRKRGG